MLVSRDPVDACGTVLTRPTIRVNHPDDVDQMIQGRKHPVWMFPRLLGYARRVGMDEIEANDCNLNISRYVSTAKQEVAINLLATHKELVEIEKRIQESTAKHNAFLKELGLSPLPAPDK